MQWKIRMKLLVFNLHFWLKRVRKEKNNVINTVTQIQDKKENTAQDQLEFEE